MKTPNKLKINLTYSLKNFVAALMVLITPVIQADVTLHYVQSDHLGTPRALSNNNGETLWQLHQTPFGKATINQDVDGDGNDVIANLRFPGQYYDGETGLHYNYYRYYDPATGRYITSDPIGLNGGLNTYGYVDGNPVNLIDPLGLKGFCPGGKAVPAPGNEHAFPKIFMCESDGSDPKNDACNNPSCVTGMPLPPTSTKTIEEGVCDQCILTCGMATIFVPSPMPTSIRKTLEFIGISGASALSCKQICKDECSSCSK